MRLAGSSKYAFVWPNKLKPSGAFYKQTQAPSAQPETCCIHSKWHTHTRSWALQRASQLDHSIYYVMISCSRAPPVLLISPWFAVLPHATVCLAFLIRPVLLHSRTTVIFLLFPCELVIVFGGMGKLFGDIALVYMESWCCSRWITAAADWHK